MTRSQLSPDFVRKIFFCTFADVEKWFSRNPYARGKRAQFYNSNRFLVMARSKSGGTRSFLRGRVGADVYSIGKDDNG